MKEKSINLQRTESLLCELIPEALGELSDYRINGLTITDVDCKNGKYDARVYFDGSDFDEKERREIISILKKANGRIKSYILSATGWYKCPNFTFLHDEKMAEVNKLDNLFAQISKSKNED
jgi:ribosome-binding factor A